MTGTFVVVGAFFGLLVGSFFNVVVYRTPRHLSVVRPGSFCPTCRAEIAAADNVPVLSWIWLRGKCRHCGEPISVRYPLVEAATAGAFAGLAATVRPLWGVPGWWALASTLGLAAVIDADGQSFTPAVGVIGCSIGAVALGIGAVTAGHTGPGVTAAVGFAAGILAATALAASRKMRERLGAGPIVTLAAFGACLGWLGTLPAAVGSGVTIGGLLATTIVVQKRIAPSAIGPRVRVPLATCLALGLVAALLTAGFRS